jgi:large subunit ribosomal protein L17
MRHQKAGRKLGRTTSHRWAMFKNMLTSFFEWEKIETTSAKAKELRPLAEKIITLGKRGDLAARREVLKLIANKKIVQKLFNEIAPKVKSRLGGYTRIVRAGFRPGDCAPMSIIEIISEEKGAEKKKGTKKKQAAGKPKPKAAKQVKKGKPSEGEPKPKEVSEEKKKAVEKDRGEDKGQENIIGSEDKKEEEKAS